MKRPTFLRLSLLILFQSLTVSAVNRRFTIIRRFEKDHDVTIGVVPDKFIMQENSSCTDCSKFNAARSNFSSSKCNLCRCSKNRQLTFGFHKNVWKCTPDEQKLGFYDNKCNLHIKRFTQTDIVLMKENSVHVLANLSPSIYGDSCKIDGNISEVLGCQANKSDVTFTDGFKLFGNKTNSKYYLQIGTIAEKNRGQIMKIKIRCHASTEPKCFMFKTVGEIKCLQYGDSGTIVKSVPTLQTLANRGAATTSKRNTKAPTAKAPTAHLSTKIKIHSRVKPTLFSHTDISIEKGKGNDGKNMTPWPVHFMAAFITVVVLLFTALAIVLFCKKRYNKRRTNQVLTDSVELQNLTIEERQCDSIAVKPQPDQNNYEIPGAVMTSSGASKHHGPQGSIQGKLKTICGDHDYQTLNTVIASSDTIANRGPQCYLLAVNPKPEQNCYETVGRVIASTLSQTEQKEGCTTANPLYSYLSDACPTKVET